MISITPQGKIYLCKTPLENDYKNQLTFTNATSQLTYFTSKVEKTLTEYTYIKQENVIKVGFPIDEIIGCNYLYYQNGGFSSKYYFCYITKMEYVNENCTRVYIEVDVWQTYQFDITYKTCFVEREHVNDDTIGKHTIPENLETGEFIINDITELGDNELNRKYIAMAYTGNPQSLFPTNTPHQYSGLYTGFSYLILSSPLDADEMIQGFADNGALEKITALFTIPYGLINNTLTSAHWYNGPNATGTDVVEVGDGNYPMFALVPSDPVGSYYERTLLTNTNVNINTTLDTYTPKNNKLFTNQFNYLYVSNNTGMDVKLNYEDFINNQPIFKIIGNVSIGCNIKLVPQNYKKYNSGTGNALYNYGVNASKYPTLAWVGDAYTNWLTQNAVNLGAGLVSGSLYTLGMAFSGNAMGTASGLTSIASQLGEIRQHQIVSETGQGNINAGDLTFSSKRMNFTIYKMSVRKEMAKIIDDYFTAYGYKVNTYKIPNITGRLNWNFVKTIECNFEGDIPQIYLQKIKQIFNNGITFWHDPTKMYDYSQSNTIVS